MPVFALTDKSTFPPVHLAEKDGLLAVGGDLNPGRLLSAYRHGIFPWFSEGDPILWWSPDPRMVLIPHEINISKSLKKVMRKRFFLVSMDRYFDQVITLCGKTRLQSGEGTWITDDMIDAYCRLYRMGYAHCVEVFQEEKLVGGLYGVSLGRCFFGESMFSTVSNSSKVALAYLCTFLETEGFKLIDCQIYTDHLAGLGAHGISRKQFMIMLKSYLKWPSKIGPWTSDFERFVKHRTSA